MKFFYLSIPTLLLFVNTSSSAQSSVDYCAAPPRYDTEVFTAVDSSANITYGANLNYQNQNTILRMDIYEPAGDTASIRPLIIFAHGGSFVVGDKSNTDQVDLCTHFAKRGYVTATINYRLGISFPIDSNTATHAAYRAVQDMKAAIRFFRKDAATANVYKIDPDMIFAGGSSAGAFTALHLAYMDQYSELPAAIDTAVLGDLEGNSGNPGYPSTINAVINLCAALGEKTWLTPGDIPIVSMHGTADNVVPYNTQMLYLLGVFPIMVVDGSYSIHGHADSIGVSNAMYTWFGAPHVPYDGGTVANQAYLDTTLRFVSNFLYSYMGCTPSDPNPLPNTFTTTGMAEAVTNSEGLLYPNPVTNMLYLELTEQPHEVVMQTMEGKTVYRNANGAGNRLQIDTHPLEKGMYLVKVQQAKGSWVRKVMVN